MNKKIFFGITIVIVVGLSLWFGDFNRENLPPDADGVVNKTSGEITSFYLARPNIVIETSDLESVSVYATLADRQSEDVLIGEGLLVEEFGNRKTWTVGIPEPMLLRKIYAIGTDEDGLNTERLVFSIAGISEIYSTLWVDVPEKITKLQIGESVKVGRTEITFNKVLEDSRCPSTVQCVQAGRFVAEILLANDVREEDKFVISSNEEELHVDNYFIKILKIEPLAIEGGILEDEYSVTFSIITDSKG